MGCKASAQPGKIKPYVCLKVPYSGLFGMSWCRGDVWRAFVSLGSCAPSGLHRVKQTVNKWHSAAALLKAVVSAL